MDKRISFLNQLKNRLNKYTDRDSGLTQTKQSPKINYSRLRAQMLSENIQSGYAFNDTSFTNSGAFAELHDEVKLSFHIYPLMTNYIVSMPEDLNQQKEPEEKKTKLRAVTGF